MTLLEEQEELDDKAKKGKKGKDDKKGGKDDKKGGKDKKGKDKGDKKDKDKKDKKGKGDKKGKKDKEDKSSDSGEKDDSGEKKQSKRKPSKDVKPAPDDAPIDVQVLVEKTPMPETSGNVGSLRLELKPPPLVTTGGLKQKKVLPPGDSDESVVDDGPPHYARVPYTEERYRHAVKSKDGKDYLLEGRRIKYQLHMEKTDTEKSKTEPSQDEEQVFWNVLPDGTISVGLHKPSKEAVGEKKGKGKKKKSKGDASVKSGGSSTSLASPASPAGKKPSKTGMDGGGKGGLGQPGETKKLPGGVTVSKKEFVSSDGRTMVAESRIGPNEMSVTVRPKDAIRDTLGDDSLAGKAIQRIENAEECDCESCSSGDHIVGGSRVSSVAQVCADCNTVLSEELLVEHALNPAREKNHPDSPMGKIEIYAPKGLNRVVQEECQLEGDHQISRVEIYNGDDNSSMSSSMGSGFEGYNAMGNPQIAVEAHRKPGNYNSMGRQPNQVINLERPESLPQIPVMPPPPKRTDPKAAWKQYEVEYQRYLNNLKEWRNLQQMMAKKVQRIHVQTDRDGEPFQLRLAIKKDPLKKQRRLEKRPPKLVKQERTVIEKNEYDIPLPIPKELPPTRGVTTVVQKQRTEANMGRAQLVLPNLQKTTTTTTIVEKEGLQSPNVNKDGKSVPVSQKTTVNTRTGKRKDGITVDQLPNNQTSVSSFDSVEMSPGSASTVNSDVSYYLPGGLFKD